MSDDPRCRRCGQSLRTGLVATTSRHCCLNATLIVGACPEHGPLGPHHVVDGDGDATANADTDETAE